MDAHYVWTLWNDDDIKINLATKIQPIHIESFLNIITNSNVSSAPFLPPYTSPCSFVYITTCKFHIMIAMSHCLLTGGWRTRTWISSRLCWAGCRSSATWGSPSHSTYSSTCSPQVRTTSVYRGRFYFYFLFFMFVIQHCFICRPSDSNVSEDAGIRLRTVMTLALTARLSNHSARSQPQEDYWMLLNIR